MIPILSARLIRIQGRPILELTTSAGLAYVEEPKAEPLFWGFAPISQADDFGALELEGGELPPNPADGRFDPLPLPYATADPLAVELARRLWAGELEEGEIDLPSMEEADAQRWERDGEGIRRAK